jgi:formylglycine-generating enzyme required for sulfatase activity
MRKPWFSGLASRREYNDFLRVSVPTSEAKQYLGASKRARLIRNSGTAILALVILFMVPIWQQGLSIEYAMLKWLSMFTSIHVEPEMVIVQDNLYRMGDWHGTGSRSERPAHDVQIRRFAIGRYEITFEEYDRFALATGKKIPHDQAWGRARRPVVDITWSDARDYAAWLSEQSGKRYRLPSEAEWEYAARSGGKDETWSGTSDEKQLAEYAVFDKLQTEPVGSRKPNGLRLHDMSGNVSEWVEDCVHLDYKDSPTDGSAWLEEGSGNCDRRIIRGGSWFNALYKPSWAVRSTFRSGINAGDRASNVGFRLAQNIE